MASTKRSSSKKNRKGSRYSGKRVRSEKKRNTHSWRQKGCQLGGGSLTGGWPWSPSDVHHGNGDASANPNSINGNHYTFNTQVSPPPANSNHLIERGQHGGKNSRRKNSRRKNRRNSRFIREQRGGMADYLPEVANTGLRVMAQNPASIMNTLQGASTAFKTADPTIQPIAAPIQLK